MIDSVLRYLRRRIRVALRRDLFVRVTSSRPLERHGSAYGGWSIAVNSLSAQAIVYSFGVGDDVSFDLSVISRYGVIVHAFDPTPRSIAWVRRQTLPAQLILHEYGIGPGEGDLVLFPPVDPSHVSFSAHKGVSNVPGLRVPVRPLSAIMHDLGHSHVDLLKMDIEGAEYDVIDSLLQEGILPGQLLVEFHHRFMPNGPDRTRAAIARLADVGYEVIAVSPSGEEFTFLRGASGTP